MARIRRILCNVTNRGGDVLVALRQILDIAGGNGGAPVTVSIHGCLIGFVIQRHADALSCLNMGGRAGNDQIGLGILRTDDVVVSQWRNRNARQISCDGNAVRCGAVVAADVFHAGTHGLFAVRNVADIRGRNLHAPTAIRTHGGKVNATVEGDGNLLVLLHILAASADGQRQA
ncbi:hypothetical protein KHDHEBDM_04013 [Pectobacterium polaris]|nr:hypothetical protein KHDHEBDM_04013 [Pectobacterium polaris]